MHERRRGIPAYTGKLAHSIRKFKNEIKTMPIVQTQMGYISVYN